MSDASNDSLPAIAVVISALSDRQHQWARFYARSFNSADAALKAGYSKRTYRQQGSENLSKPNLRRVVRHYRDLHNQALGIDKDDVVTRWMEIAFADPSELVSINMNCCRYCHGKEHVYQWRTPREYEQSLSDWNLLSDAKKAATPQPNDDGGYGYRRTNTINPECPECDGFGIEYVDITPTNNMTPGARLLFQGAHQTKDGIKVTTHDQNAALRELSKILGVYEQPDAGETANALKQWITGLQEVGSKPPLASDHPESGSRPVLVND